MAGRKVLGMPVARLVPWAVLAVGLVTTLILDHSIGVAVNKRQDSEFTREMLGLEGKIDDGVARQVSILQATAGVIAANPRLGRNEFAAFYRNLAQSQDAKIPITVGLSLWRPWSRRDELAADASQRGVVGYRLRPKAPRAQAHAVVLAEPDGSINRRAPGYDMHADPTRGVAMDRAIATGKVAMTGRVVLAPDRATGAPGFVLYMPVLSGPNGAPIGLVFSGLRAESLWSALRGDMAKKGIGLRLWAGGEEPSNLVFDQPLRKKAIDSRITEIPLNAVNGTLHAEFQISSDFGTPPQIRPWVVPVGTVLSLLLFLLASVLRRANESSERREAEQSLLAEVGRLTVGTADAEDVLCEIASSTGRTLEAGCRIDLLEPNGTLRTINTRTEGKQVLADLERDFPRLQYDTLFKRALETGTTQQASGYRSENETHQARIAALNVGPVLIVPLWLGDRSLGAITLVRSKGRRDFPADASKLVEAIAGRMAFAIDNVRLYRDMERRVDERTRDLEASNHELESFCYSVSHDLRTPLRSLDGFGRALQEDYGDRLDAQGLDFIERIRASTKRMDELITALLTLSRLTRREIVPVDVDVTSMVFDQMHDLDPEGRVELDVTPGLILHADPRMLAIVFDNLLSNAIKFTSRGDGPAITVGRTDEGAVFVRDNGAGFNMAYAAKLFQPFERLHSVREFPGHGIGLATVERIVRRHGGEVRAEGEPGKGATFFVSFPR